MTVNYQLGLLGYPVGHSLSPCLHQAALHVKDNLLARAFAGGNQQSTVFGDAAGRVAKNQALVAGQILTGGNQRKLDLRKALAEQFLQSAALRRDTLASGGELNLADINAQLDQRKGRAALLDAAQQRAMGLTQNARSAQEFDLDLGVRRSQVAVDRSRVNLGRQELMFKDKWFQQEQGFNREQFLEQIRQFNLGFGLDVQALERGAYEYGRDRKDRNRNAWLSSAATLFGAWAGMG